VTDRLSPAPIAWIAACLLLAGCAGSAPRTAPQIYDLVSEAAPVSISERRPQQLSIAAPRASQMLDSARIAVRPTAGELRYYAAASWRDPAPRLLQDAMMRAFEDSGAFAAVGRGGDGLAGDLRLTTELRRFETEYVNPGAAPDAVVELQVTLLRGGDGRALASHRFRAVQPVADVAVPQVVRALAAATDQVVGELVRWVVQEADRQRGPEAAAAPTR
jgi:cholesterol transport system auxiliary component